MCGCVGTAVEGTGPATTIEGDGCTLLQVSFSTQLYDLLALLTTVYIVNHYIQVTIQIETVSVVELEDIEKVHPGPPYNLIVIRLHDPPYTLYEVCVYS